MSSSPSPPRQLTIHSLTQETLPSFRRLTSTLLPIRYPDSFYTALLRDCGLENAFSIARVAIWAETGADGTVSGKGQVVGGIVARIQDRDEWRLTPGADGESEGDYQVEGERESQIYIATLAVLAPWRGQGIATALVDAVVGAAQDYVAGLETLSLPLVFGDGSNTNIQADANPSSILPHNTLAVPPVPQISPVRGPPSLGRIILLYAHVWEANDDGLEWYRARGFRIGEVMPGYYRKLKPGGARIVRRGLVGWNVRGLGNRDVG